MPRTTFRLRVAPILNIERHFSTQDVTQEESIMSHDQPSETPESTKEKKTTFFEQGEWSEVTNITTKETQTFDVSGMISPKAPNLMCAQLVTKGRKRWLNFDKAGTILSTYGYSFGEHLWILKINFIENQPSLMNSQLSNSASQISQQYQRE